MSKNMSITQPIVDAFYKAVHDVPVTACLMNDRYDVLLLMSGSTASDIGRKLAINKARGAIFYAGYVEDDRKKLATTTDSSLLQLISWAKLSPSSGSVGIEIDGQQYAIGVMANGGISTTKHAFNLDETTAIEIAKGIPGCKVLSSGT